MKIVNNSSNDGTLATNNLGNIIYNGYSLVDACGIYVGSNYSFAPITYCDICNFFTENLGYGIRNPYINTGNNECTGILISPYAYDLILCGCSIHDSIIINQAPAASAYYDNYIHYCCSNVIGNNLYYCCPYADNYNSNVIGNNTCYNCSVRYSYSNFISNNSCYIGNGACVSNYDNYIINNSCFKSTDDSNYNAYLINSHYFNYCTYGCRIILLNNNDYDYDYDSINSEDYALNNLHVISNEVVSRQINIAGCTIMISIDCEETYKCIYYCLCNCLVRGECIKNKPASIICHCSECNCYKFYFGSITCCCSSCRYVMCYYNTDCSGYDVINICGNCSCASNIYISAWNI